MIPRIRFHVGFCAVATTLVALVWGDAAIMFAAGYLAGFLFDLFNL